MDRKTVAVLGGCGRIGLPLTWIIANSGHFVHCIDPKAVTEPYKSLGLEHVPFPYTEDGFRNDDTSHLWKSVFTNKVNMTNLYGHIVDSEVIIVVIGTPVDAENNPRVDAIIDLFKDAILPRMTKKQLIILRSTVNPGFTDMIRIRLLRDHGKAEGVDYHMVFAPERVSQGHSLTETFKLPQLIGADNDESYKMAVEFFEGIGVKKCIRLSPIEAEYGKLITNMYRYVNIALANEFYMITSKDPVGDIDAHKIIQACNEDYPRMNMPLPGPNAAGPCLFKDGKLLTMSIPYSDLINGSFHINEGMPMHMIDLLQKKAYDHGLEYMIRNVLIVGAAFKPEQDDIRFSASYKLKKLLKVGGYNADMMDYYAGETTVGSIYQYDVIVIMTPHREAINYLKTYLDGKKLNPMTIIVDGWKSLGDHSKNGVFLAKEYNQNG